MVAGLHRYFDRELAASAERRTAKPDRDRLRKLLGVVDERAKPRMELVAPLGESAERELGGCRVTAVRWAVFPGVFAEGWHVRGADEPRAFVVALDTPDEVVFRLARNGCEVLVVTLLDRADAFSANPKLNRWTNIPHREFVHRMAFEVGRTLTGYEVQTVLAAADWFHRKGTPKVPLGVVGHGDGGRVALYAAALDERFDVCQVSGAFGPQETAWERPLDRNLFGLLTAFGDAEAGSLVAPRKLIVDAIAGPTWDGPVPPKPGRAQAAPGTLAPIPEADVAREFARLKKLAGDAAAKVGGGTSTDTDAFLAAVGVPKPSRDRGSVARLDPPDGIQKRLLDQWVGHTLAVYRDGEAARKAFWAKADASSPEAWGKSCEPYRTYFHERVIGKMPPTTLPPNPRTRRVYDEPTWAGYEVKLDLHADVFAFGIVLIPKDLKPGEKRPAVVCQHGLEGTPRHCIDPEKRPTYNQFARKLVELGYVVYCPQNPYVGGNTFRQVQRKANLLGLSLFSVIVQQHAVTLDWLQTLPGVDPDRIGLYGLSYGGKTAMRVPAVEKRYKASICSGDFNEWIGKNVRVDLPMSYMFTGEYEMYEFDLGNTFNYAEMASLIAPRPFMVERGHDDGVGTDEMVSYEFARVRYLYANRLRLPDRAEIEYNVGGHANFNRGTFAFLEKHLGPVRK